MPLVCRQWRDACGKLPVKLERVPLDKLQKAADLFPKAKTLRMDETIYTTGVRNEASYPLFVAI